MNAQPQNPIEILNQIFARARGIGLVHQIDQGETHQGRTLILEGKSKVNFGSCGYMGLEFDSRLKEGSIEAIRRYGTELSCSRAFLSNPLYPELEQLLEQIFLRPALVAPSTTLMHLSAIPVLIGPEDVILLDQQVHNSVQLAASVVKAAGTQVDFVPHNNPARLERKIKAYKETKKKIWYLADGVYSMYGDFAPASPLADLLSRYEQLQLYMDDAHGMSWYGDRGKGYVLSEFPDHERLFVATSFSKGFGSGGGAILCPNRETRQTIRNCGRTQIFSSPIQPGVLGAAVASAKIHLSPEFPEMQSELQLLNKICTSSMETLPLPIISDPNSPIRFIGIGTIDHGQKIVKRVIELGYWLNIAQYPAVGPNHSGIRFMITRSLKSDDIRGLTEAIRSATEEVLGGDEKTYQQIWKAFSKEYRYSLVNG